MEQNIHELFVGSLIFLGVLLTILMILIGSGKVVAVSRRQGFRIHRLREVDMCITIEGFLEIVKFVDKERGNLRAGNTFTIGGIKDETFTFCLHSDEERYEKRSHDNTKKHDHGKN